MISKDHRFHGYNKLQAVYRQGKTARVAMLSLKVFNNPRRSSYRLAVVVSRKVHKSAVVRNRVRRRLFEACRQYEHLFGSNDMVITVFSDALATAEARDVEKMVKKLLQAAGFGLKPSVPPPSESPDHGIVKTYKKS